MHLDMLKQMGIHAHTIPSDTRDLSPLVMDEDGLPRILPASFYENTTVAERALLGHRNGLYSLPTLELVDCLRMMIGNRSAIEIGAGNGVLARALGIPATDSFQQQDPNMGALYGIMQQPTVRYGPNVEKLDAAAAIEKYKPQVVVACWVTHLYREDRHQAGGNAWGVDEEAVLDACEHYLFIGNAGVHKDKSIWSRPHQAATPDWLYSRTASGQPNVFVVVPGAKWRAPIGQD